MTVFTVLQARKWRRQPSAICRTNSEQPFCAFHRFHDYSTTTFYTTEMVPSSGPWQTLQCDPDTSTVRASGAYNACLTTLKRKHALQSEGNVFYKSFCFKMIHRTIILPVVLYGCETWCLTLREECGFRVFEENIWA